MRILVCTLLLAGSVAAQEGTATKLQGAFSRDEYPLALGDRPLVLPHLMLEATPQFEYVKISPSDNASAIGLRVGFGLADRYQIDAITGFDVDPSSEWNKMLTGQLSVLAYDSRDLDVAGVVRLPFDFADGHDLFTGGMIGANTRFRLTHQFYLYGLRDLIGFGTKDQFSLGLNGSVGVGIEPIRHLSLEVGTTLVHLKVAGDFEKTRWIGADYVPAEALVNVAINRNLDVIGALVVPDFKNGFDAVTVLGGINARL